MKAPDIEGLLAALANGEVDYVLIGALALAAHGPVRATEDVDVVPDPDPDNLRRLGNLLSEIGGRLSADPTQEFDERMREQLSKGKNLTLTTDLGEIDVVQRLPGVPSYSELVVAAERLRLLGVEVQVCGRDHLRAMKLARGSHRDLADVEDLDALDR